MPKRMSNEELEELRELFEDSESHYTFDPQIAVNLLDEIDALKGEVPKLRGRDERPDEEYVLFVVQIDGEDFKDDEPVIVQGYFDDGAPPGWFRDYGGGPIDTIDGSPSKRTWGKVMGWFPLSALLSSLGDL